VKPTLSIFRRVTDLPVKVWVLAPWLQGNDPHIDYYYDFSQSIAEYEKTFTELGVEWVWQPVSLDDFREVLSLISAEKEAGRLFPFVFNLCDGDEVNGTPGISIVRELRARGLAFSGSDEHFYQITTSKVPMKRAFDQAGVSTPPWVEIKEPEFDPRPVLAGLGVPVLVKPSVSGGSMGIGIDNVVYTPEALQTLVRKLYSGYRNWNLASDGLIAESFITGSEYTVLIVGDFDHPQQARVYTPVERVFHPSLPEDQQFLSFDRLWEIYEHESPMPGEENFYEYGRPPESLIAEIARISWDAYVSNRGRGYARIDVRRDKNTGRLHVLEVNAQCGLSEDEDFTSIGAILSISGETFPQRVKEIIANGMTRYQALNGSKNRKQQVTKKADPEKARPKIMNHAGRAVPGK